MDNEGPDPASRFLFVHVMKTGGTSLALHLLKQFRPSEMYPDAQLDRRGSSDVAPYASLRNLLALSPARRAEIRVFAGHFPFMARDLIGPDVRTFTMLRDPVERTVSVLKHFKRLRARYRDLSLEEIYDDPVVFRFFVENHQTKVFSVSAADSPDAFASGLSFEEISARLDEPGRDARMTALNPEARGTITIDAARFARAKANLAAVDVIGIADDFHAFIEALRARFGWWSSGIDDRPRANVSTESWETSASLRARITADCGFDLELYAHACELIGRRRS